MKRYHLHPVYIILTFAFLIFALPQSTFSEETASEQITSGQKMIRRDGNKEGNDERMKLREAFAQENKKKREAFKAKLDSIKDENKQKIVEKINTQLATINRRHTSMLSTVLTKFEDILARIIKKTHALADEGINTIAIDADITDAEVAISKAKSAIETQSERDYTIEISDEAGLKTSISTTRQLLHSDLKAVRELVKTAHESVKTAAETLHTTKEQS